MSPDVIPLESDRNLDVYTWRCPNTYFRHTVSISGINESSRTYRCPNPEIQFVIPVSQKCKNGVIWRLSLWLFVVVRESHFRYDVVPPATFIRFWLFFKLLWLFVVVPFESEPRVQHRLLRVCTPTTFHRILTSLFKSCRQSLFLTSRPEFARQLTSVLNVFDLLTPRFRVCHLDR